MIAKIAFKNIKKSFKEYSIYFLTLVMGVCIFYMFNSIYAQKELMAFTEITSQSIDIIREGLSYISIFVAVVLGFLIVYANNFFIKRRKKELGIYMTLGMHRGNISKVFLLETLFIGFIALITGLVLGVVGSQLMSIFTAKIFEADMTSFKFIFSLDAAIKSIIYFSIIFLIVMIFNSYVISKYKLIDLIYGSVKNQEYKIKKSWISLVIFGLSIIFLVISYGLVLKNGILPPNKYLFISILFGTLGTILFFLSFSGILMNFIFSSKNIYFKNLNIFVCRQLSHKINTNYISLSVICILLLLVIGIFSSGFSMQNLLSSNFKRDIPYDFSVYALLDEVNTYSIYESFPEDIKSMEEINYSEISKYLINDTRVRDFNLDLSLSKYPHIENYAISFVGLSDFNSALNLKGKDSIYLEKDRYLVTYSNDIDEDIANQIVSKNVRIELKQEELYPLKDVYMGKLSNNNYEFINFVVNDELLKDENIFEKVLNINLEDKDTANILNDILREEMINNDIFTYFDSKIDIAVGLMSTKAMISFLAIYLSIVFMITCTAILAIQQISDIFDNKHRYNILRRLGVENRDLNKALFIQVLFYFLFPLVLSIIHSIVGLIVVNDVIKNVGNMDVTTSIFITFIFVLVVYGVYFYLTYSGSKNIINNKK